MWGSAKNSIIKPLNSLLSKIWRKIGRYRQHTLNRLTEHNILKLEHELEIQESKLVWKWTKNKIPSGLKPLIVERQNILRSRRFENVRGSKNDSINYRLFKCATNSINRIDNFMSIIALPITLVKKLLVRNIHLTVELEIASYANNTIR